MNDLPPTRARRVSTVAPGPAPGAEPAGRWLALAALAVAALLAMAPWFSTAAVLPQLRLAWQLSSSAGALLTIAVQLGFVFGALASALLNLADLIAPRRLILAGALAAAAANAALAACHGAASALPLRFATGASLALVYPPAIKLMATWFRRGRGMALGVMVGALTLGSALPHLVNALGGADWRVGTLVTSLLAAAGGVLGALAGREGPFPFSRARFDPRQLGRVFQNRGVKLASVGYFGHMWELYAMWSWIGAFLADAWTRAGRPNPRLAASLATFAVIGIGGLGCWAGGILGDRWGRAQSAALSMMLSGACAASVGWLGNLPLPWLVALTLFWGFWVVADSAQFSTMVTEYADSEYVGTALTAQLGVGFTLTVVTIWLIPIIRAHGHWGWAFTLLVPGPLLGVEAMRRLINHPYRSAAPRRATESLPPGYIQK